jgi:hypothetical protein
MKVALKRCEHLAVEHAKRFTTAWDYFCVATGAYLAGYRAAKEDIFDYLEGGSSDEYFMAQYLRSMMRDLYIEQEVSDGTHQLAVASFHKFQKEVDDLSFAEAMKKLLTNYHINDIRVDVDASGVVSFQGTARKKD